MVHVSSKRIIFINIDKPPEKVADYIENYTNNLILRLNLHQSAYWTIDIENEQCCTESLIQSASCVVIGALWPLELDQRRKKWLSSVMRKLEKRGIPLLVLGTAEPILLKAIGCKSKLYSGNLGLAQIQRVNQQEIMALPMIQCWGWRVSDIQADNIRDPIVILNETCNGDPVLIRHSEFLFSSPFVFGLTTADMACWLHCFPYYLKGNESAIELGYNDISGLNWLINFIETWNEKKQSKAVH